MKNADHAIRRKESKQVGDSQLQSPSRLTIILILEIPHMQDLGLATHPMMAFSLLPEPFISKAKHTQTKEWNVQVPGFTLRMNIHSLRLHSSEFPAVITPIQLMIAPSMKMLAVARSADHVTLT